MPTLFDIGEELLALNALLEDAEVELNPEALAAVDEWFRSIAGNEAEKLIEHLLAGFNIRVHDVPTATKILATALQSARQQGIRAVVDSQTHRN